MNNENNTNEYSEERTFSLKKSGIFLSLIIFAIIVSLLTIKGCNISKETDESDVTESEAVVEEVESTSEQIETEAVEEEESAPSNNYGITSEDGSLLKTAEPVLSENIETTAIVSGKDVYTMGNTQYVYSISLLFPQGDEYIIVKYFCPKKTYDGVVVNETVNALYQHDASGCISVSSIYK